MVIRSVRTGAARKRSRTVVSDAGDDIDLGFFSDAIGFYLRTAHEAAFRAFLAALGYPHVDESRNPAYRLFLG